MADIPDLDLSTLEELQTAQKSPEPSPTSVSAPLPKIPIAIPPHDNLIDPPILTVQPEPAVLEAPSLSPAPSAPPSVRSVEPIKPQPAKSDYDSQTFDLHGQPPVVNQTAVTTNAPVQISVHTAQPIVEPALPQPQPSLTPPAAVVSHGSVSSPPLFRPAVLLPNPPSVSPESIQTGIVAVDTTAPIVSEQISAAPAQKGPKAEQIYSEATKEAWHVNRPNALLRLLKFGIVIFIALGIFFLWLQMGKPSSIFKVPLVQQILQQE